MATLHLGVSTKSRMTRGKLALLVGSVVATLLTMGVLHLRLFSASCNGEALLAPFLLRCVRALRSADAQFWLDYGTLLGAYREKGVVPFEFDLDFGVMRSECQRLLQMRDHFREHGLLVFGRGDYIWTKRWGRLYDLAEDGTIHVPCMRLYDTAMSYYADVYDYWETPAREVPPMFLAEHEAPSTLYLCNEESAELIPGGCRPLSIAMPLRELTLYGEAMPVPPDIPATLESMYGPSFMTPLPKGYKALLCAASGATVTVALATWLTLWALALYFGGVRMRDLRWAAILPAPAKADDSV